MNKHQSYKRLIQQMSLAQHIAGLFGMLTLLMTVAAPQMHAQITTAT